MVIVKAHAEFTEWFNKEIVPQQELAAWRASIKKVNAESCPLEVRQFIEAVSKKLDDFGRIGQDMEHIEGSELLLCGLKEIKGEKVDPYTSYPIPVPRMQAVDHEAAMYRIFDRKGKQGLIDYVSARLKGTELEKLLYILDLHVFHEERPEFKKMLADFDAAKKLDVL